MSIRRALFISVPVGAVWSICQAVLEFRTQPAVESASTIGNQTESSKSDKTDAYFLYGGVIFMLAETSFFVLVPLAVNVVFLIQDYGCVVSGLLCSLSVGLYFSPAWTQDTRFAVKLVVGRLLSVVYVLGCLFVARTSFYVYCLIVGLCHSGQCIGLALILSYEGGGGDLCSGEHAGYW